MRKWIDIYSKITTPENIFLGWEEFRNGKKKKKDIIDFERHLEDNIFNLYHSLKEKTYKPGDYTAFHIRDPKARLIHKATVSDRVVHHIVSRALERIFDPTFIAHSYSCRINKGTHKGVKSLQTMALKVSKNNRRPCWVLKCDVKKFFASVNHHILFKLLTQKIRDKEFLWLLEKIIDSFHSEQTVDLSNLRGIPIGNLTSQYFANIYLNYFDQFVKQKLRIKHYIRYADDFVIISNEKSYLENQLEPIKKFLKDALDLELHPDKIFFNKFTSGIDFLGYVIFPRHILARTRTKRRLKRRIKTAVSDYKSGRITKGKLTQIINSYLGYLGHANTFQFSQELKNSIWFWLTE